MQLWFTDDLLITVGEGISYFNGTRTQVWHYQEKTRWLNMQDLIEESVMTATYLDNGSLKLEFSNGRFLTIHKSVLDDGESYIINHRGSIQVV